MISYEVYKVLHLSGVLMVFLALGASAANAMAGVATLGRGWRRLVAITHGLGMLLSLVAGFGLLARLGLAQGGIPGWAMAKLAIWAVFGILLGVYLRRPAWTQSLWPVTIALGVTAAYLAGSKPF